MAAALEISRRVASPPSSPPMSPGYSRLMGRNEEGTLERLMAHRRAFDPKIAEHHGRIVKTTGDGLLAEFPSVVDGVRCAVAGVRRGSWRSATRLSRSASGSSWVGINLSDVIV